MGSVDVERTGKLTVDKVGGKSTVTTCFSKYPLKFIIPTKVGPSKIDAIWIYTLTYGGGIVSGDSISCDFIIGDGCTCVLTTQSSTKVYKSVGSKCSEQILEARIGSDSLLAVIPDPVTCFATARYSQKQIFRLHSDSSLVVVDWITSGRHESGEKWDFSLYKSSNNIFLDDDQPLFLDTVVPPYKCKNIFAMELAKLLLEEGSTGTVSERMRDYQVSAMVILLGPKLKHIQNQVQENVKRMMSEQLHMPVSGLSRHLKPNPSTFFTRLPLIASCSVFGPKGIGIVVRIAAMTTESVYNFLQHQLADMEPLIGVLPYR